MITVTINGERHEIPDGFSLDSLLDFFSLPKQRTAVELNATVISRADWADTVLNDADRIEVVHLVGGG